MEWHFWREDQVICSQLSASKNMNSFNNILVWLLPLFFLPLLFFFSLLKWSPKLGCVWNMGTHYTQVNTAMIFTTLFISGQNTDIFFFAVDRLLCSFDNSYWNAQYNYLNIQIIHQRSRTYCGNNFKVTSAEVFKFASNLCKNVT